MKKILLIGPLSKIGTQSKVGGLSKYVSDILNTNFEYDINHFNIARPLKKIINNNQFGYKSLLNGGFFRMLNGVIITLWHIFIYPFVLIKYNPNIVHIAATSNLVFWEDSYYLIVSKIFNKKIFIHYLGSFDIFYYSSCKFKKGLIRYILKKCDKIGVLSLKVKKIISSFVDPNNIIMLPSSIDYSLFTNNNKMLDLPNDNYIKILFLGGYDAYKKGIEDVIAAIPKILEKNKNVMFILSSSKKLNVKINKEYENILLLDWIPLEDKIPLYNSCDIFLLPSYDEGLPYSLIEAMAAGLPIIASNIGGIPEVVKDNENGFLINPGDIQEMLNKINFLIENESVRLKMGINNKNLIKSNYSLDNNIKKIKEVYISI
jgi:glycosyltransferase involved in cell wall biosynthesis